MHVCYRVDHGPVDSRPANCVDTPYHRGALRSDR